MRIYIYIYIYIYISNYLNTGFVNNHKPFIGIDGCHLKGPYESVLLSVMELDGNNGCFLVAYAIV
jgi:hypothetical protein